jgi:hypothetical protein
MTFGEVRAFKGTLPQRITGYHIVLDGSGREKIRRRGTKRLALDAILVAGTFAIVDIGAV